MDDFSKERRVPFLQGAAQLLSDENKRLRAERADLEARLAASEAARAEAHAEAVRVAGDLARLETELAGLAELLDLRTKLLYGKSTERRPRDKAPKGQKRRGGKPRKGHGPTAQPDLPEVDVTHNIPDELLTCEACGGRMKAIDTLAEEAQLIALERRRVVLENHIRTVYGCTCGKCIKTATGPLKLLVGGRYDLSFTVHVGYQKYFAHMPLERQAKMFGHEGLVVTTATLCDQLDALATALANTYDIIWKVIQAEKVLRADETPWAIMSNGFNENEQFYAWVAVGSKYVAFRLLDTRSADGAAAILGSFSGTLVVDGLTSYPAAAKAGPGKPPKFKVANCHAHARRGLVEMEKHWPAESQFAVELYRQIYEVERDGRKVGADLGALRCERGRPLVDKLFDWARAQKARPEVLPSSLLAKAVNYLLNHEVGLRVYLDDPAVPIDNNESERAVRPTVMGRANYGGSRSRRGTEVHAIISTLVESAKRCGVSPEAYLMAAAEHALTKAGAVLLPDEFKRQLDAVRGPPKTT